METTIHESLIDGAKNAVGAFASFIKGEKNDNEKDKNKNYLGGSISQYSKNLIMTFPVLCDNTLSPETASMISKANERNVTTMLMLLFSAMNIEANDGMKVLAQVHKNISTSMDVYEVLDKMDDIADNLTKASGTVAKFETVQGIYGKESEVINEMMNELKSGKLYKAYPVNSLNEESLDKYSINKTYRGIVVKEDVGRKLTDQEKDDIINHIMSQLSEQWDNIFFKYTTEDMYDYITSEEFKISLNAMSQQLGHGKIYSDSDIDEIRKEVINQLTQTKEFKKFNLQNLDLERKNEVRLMDTDVKKANEMQPTILQINYSQKKDNGDIELRSFLAGVKSRLVGVSSTDIIERLIAKNKTKINFLNFIRATTGEIGFFKDFLFAIDQAKIDSKNAVKKGEAAAIWNCLADRAASNNKNKLKKMGNDASAITVLTLSQETVNYMKNIHKFDLEKMNNTKMICDAYNLMGIIIADESIEVVKSFYVGNNGYEQIAYSFLEKENKNSDYKKVINLLGKTNVR